MTSTVLWSATTVRFVLLGAATGALAALVALGIVLVHRTSGIVNFAAGAVGAVGAFVCYGLRDGGLPGWLALVAGLVVSGGLGLLTFAVMMALRERSLLARLIATLGLFGAAQGFMLLMWGGHAGQPASLLPSRTLTLAGSVRIGEDRLILVALVVGLAFLLRMVYSGTTFGLATSAVAENPRVAASAGWSTPMIQLVNFTLAGILSGVAAIFLAPIVTLNAAVLSVAMLLPALAAALVGGFSSFAITVGTALAIGILQSQLMLFQPEIADFLGVSPPSLNGVAQSVPLLIILGFVIVRGRPRLERGEDLIRLPLPGSGEVAVAPLLVGIALAAWLLISVGSWTDALITTFAMAIMIASVVVVSGFAGQLSLCQFALGGFGAWVAARLSSDAGISFPISLLAAVAATAAVGVLVALPALRTRGVNLAIATFALALMFNALIFTNTALTGGVVGLPVAPPTIIGVDVDPVMHPDRYAGLVLVALVLTGLLVANLRRGRVGRRMLAVRSNERAAASLGVGVVGIKLYSFGLGAAIAALGGVLLAFRQTNVQLSHFNVFGSVSLVEYAVLGGIGWISGVLAGAMFDPGGLGAQIGHDVLPSVSNLPAWLAIGSGLGVISVLVQAPDGMASIYSRTFRRVLKPLRRRKVRSPRRLATAQERGYAPLRVEDITVRFDGIVAADSVTFDVRPGEIVGLMGPNGAGKTTVLDVITGFTTASAGTVRLDGQPIDHLGPESRSRLGVVRSWQGVDLFDEMTVLDNLLVAADAQSPWAYLSDLLRPGQKWTTPAIEAVIERFALHGILDERPANLSQGTARLVGIARAMVCRPRVLLLDEPAAGLDGEESAELARSISRLASEEGLGILVVEHDVELLREICDHLVVLDFGQQIADGSPDEVCRQDRVVSAYLGEMVLEATSSATRPHPGTVAPT